MTPAVLERKKSARVPRGHLCQCAEDCHSTGPCGSLIERGVFVSRPDPFNGGRHPATFVRLCGGCAERHLSTEKT